MTFNVIPSGVNARSGAPCTHMPHLTHELSTSEATVTKQALALMTYIKQTSLHIINSLKPTALSAKPPALRSLWPQCM